MHRHWRYSPAPYNDREIDIWTDHDIVEYKTWFDPGKNPNKSRYSIEEWKRVMNGGTDKNGLRSLDQPIPSDIKKQIEAFLESAAGDTSN